MMVMGRERDASKGEETLENRNWGMAKHRRTEPCARKPEAAFEPEPGAVQTSQDCGNGGKEKKTEGAHKIHSARSYFSEVLRCRRFPASSFPREA